MARKFMYNGMELTDFNPKLTPEQIKDLHAATYAELTNAEITGPETQGDDQVYKFTKKVGAKG